MKNHPGIAPLTCILAALTAAAPLLAQETPSAAPAVTVVQDAPAPIVRNGQPTLFSFRAEGVPIKQALALFARANQLNIIPDLDIEGDVTVEFRDLPLDYAMNALLEANGYYFVNDGKVVRVRNRETRIFQIDYIQATRAGQGSNAVQISSGSSGGSGGGGGGSSGGGSSSEGSSMTVTNTSTINFWGDLGDQLKSMVSATGSYTINSLSGTVLVRDSHRNIEMIKDYLEAVTSNVVRQIDLEVEIYEVALSDSFQLGINWQHISSRLDSTVSSIPGTIGLLPNAGLIVDTPVYGTGVPGAGIRISHQRGDFTAVLDALKQQGELKVVSKPRLRTLNNQPAVVRVGQDLPVFLLNTTITPGGNTPIVTETETIQTITVGTVLSITPQVSADGLITLDITPAVSRLVRMEISKNNNKAPVIDIRQASSIVRVRDGATIIMGGLVQDTQSTTRRKVPLLGDIPLLGKAFTGKYEKTERTELVFFLTPRIIHDAATENSVKTTVK